MNTLEIIDNFHFLRPLFLLALIPLGIMVWLLRSQVQKQSGWQGILASHLYDNLVSTESGKQSTPPWSLLVAGWLILCLALAGPTWERLPQPVYQVSKGKVILLDMSMSLRAEDIKPNRLSRIKFKAIDMLKAMQEGETGLVAYAGDAFVISPLTTDVQNLEALIPSLSPEIMPRQGSDAQFALETTFELLRNAGYQSGDIFWLTDGIELSEVAALRNLLSDNDYRINILSVGTEDGAPIKLQDGNFLKDSRGAVVIPKVRNSVLDNLARSSGGRFVQSRPDDADVTFLTQPRLEAETSEESESDENFGDQWKEFGPWLLLLLVPVAAYSFRRGVLPAVLLVVLLPHGQQAHADWWQDLWQTKNQQGAKSFQSEDFQVAAEQFEDPMWKGLSHFSAGEYEQAAEIYSTMDTADSNFAMGNAFAQNQQLPEAIAAYERALELDADYPNAAENKQYLEDLLEQQQQNSDSDDQQQDQNDQQDQQDQQEQNQQDQQDQQDQQQDSQQQNSDDQQQSDQQEQQEQQSQSEQQSEQEQEQQDSQAQENEQQEQEQQQAQQEQNEQEGEEQQAQMQQSEELTDEQKEQLQKIENWLRKVPDDPAFLLKRKMLLEQQRRQRQRLPSDKKNW